MRIFWHEKHTESHIRNRKNPKNATKHNELSMHTKINISMVLIKIIPKNQRLKITKAIDSAHTRCRPAAAKRGL